MKRFAKWLALFLLALIIALTLWGIVSTRPDVGLTEADLPPESTIVYSGSAASRSKLFSLINGSRLLHALVDMEDISIDEIRAFRADIEAKRVLRSDISLASRPLGNSHAVYYRAKESTPDNEQMVWVSFHGGAYTSGTPTSPYELNTNLMDATGWPLIAPAYRLAPEHPYPAAVDDALAAWQDLLQRYPAEQLVLTGESAGGGLALALMLRLKSLGLPLPRAAVLFSPWTDVSLSGESLRSRADRDFLNPKEVSRWAAAYAGDQNPEHPEISPLFGDLAGLPPILILVGSEEIILDDSLRLQRRLREAGVDSQLQLWQGMWHIWPNAKPEAFPEVDQTKAAIRSYLTQYIPTLNPGNGSPEHAL